MREGINLDAEIGLEINTEIKIPAESGLHVLQ